MQGNKSLFFNLNELAIELFPPMSGQYMKGKSNNSKNKQSIGTSIIQGHYKIIELILYYIHFTFNGNLKATFNLVWPI